MANLNGSAKTNLKLCYFNYLKNVEKIWRTLRYEKNKEGKSQDPVHHSMYLYPLPHNPKV